MPNERLRLHLAGQKIGNYLLIKRISAGGMAEVYLAERSPGEHSTTGTAAAANRDEPARQFAVKVVCPTNEVTLESGITDVEERFIREGALLQQLHHPGIMPVYETGADRGYLYHVMEYVPNGSLADAIWGRCQHSLQLPLAPFKVLDIVRQVGAALDYIHARGIVHRDIKPGNLLVRIDQLGTWHLLLADFGVACREVTAAPQEDQVAGTIAYMAPEEFSGWFSPATDQYSLAVLAFQLLTGHLPFEGSFEEQIAGHLHVIAPSVRMYAEDVTWEIEEVIARALEKREADRYPSVSAFVQDLDAAWREAETGAETVPLAAIAAVHAATQASIAAPRRFAKPRPPYRFRALVTVVAALILLLATSIVLTAFPQVSGLPRSSSHASPGTAKLSHSRGATPVPTISATPAATAPAPPTTAGEPVVTSVDGAKLVALSLPSSASAGGLFSFQVTLVNTGTSTWIGGQGYRLTCDRVRHPTQNCPGGFEATLGAYQVAPGREVTFQIWLTALATPGVYTAWINMTHSSEPFATQDILVSVPTLAAGRSTASTAAPPAPPLLA